MRLRWSHVVAATLVLVTPIAASAQRGGGFGRGGSLLAAPPVQMRLQLNADQKSKIEGIQMKSREQMRALFQAGAGDRQAAAAQMRELNQKADAEMAALLNADQKKQYDVIKADVEGWSGLGRAATALVGVSGLNAEQKTKLGALSKDGMTKRQALIQSLQGGGGGEVREKMQALDAESATGIKQVLNADQGKQFDEALKSLPQPGRRPNN